MSRGKKIIINILILGITSFILLGRLGLFFTPLSAHENSERSINYGPSKVIHIENFKGGKYILGTYDKWISCDTVNRVGLIFWVAGSQPVGFENDTSKAVSYTWYSSAKDFRVYGIVNDNDVKKIEVTLSNGEVLTQTDFYEDLFLIRWKRKENLYFSAIRGYDEENRLIYEENTDS